MKKFIFLFLAVSFCAGAHGQVVNTSHQTQSGEKVLRFEFIIPLSKQEAWNLFTTDKELEKWIAPKAHIELKNGGYILTNYNKDKSLADTSSIRLGIINYLEGQLLTLKVELNNHFSKKLQEEDVNLQELIQFEEVEPGKTKIVSSMIGWGNGDDWKKTYNFFEKGNEWSYKELLKLFNN